ncbi:Extended synaptotagmin-3 (E-Syt3) [Durusdinium trenchii]|uniref:Extended synaptotagmin-3 (E-Syt3) n=1 Tax=Durusdinium trenchii TaxID=1381693 RepID=A0ABP0RQC2_9DINO
MSWRLKWAPRSWLGRLVGHHYAFVLTRWGFGKSFATVLARAGSQKLALGAVATGATGLTIHHNTKERHFESDVLSSEEEVEWLNAAIKPIWDHLDKGVRKIIEDEIQPALQQRLGRLGNFIQLQFTQLSLGSASPRFGPVRVTRSSHGLEINAGFSLEGNGMLEFSAGVASIQVCDITVQGTLRLGLQPLLESLNPVGGVSVTCLDRPIIDLTIKTGTELIPNLYNFVRDTVDDVIAGLIVIPNMVAVPIDPATDSCFIQHPLPLGFLRLSLEGVTAAGPLPSSVYVEVLIGCSVWKSAIAKVSSYSRQVEWVEGNVTDLEVYSQDQLLRFRCWSSGSFGVTLLSSGQVHVRDLTPGHVEVPLSDTQEHGENSSVELYLSWMPVMNTPPRSSDADLLASVHVDRAELARSTSLGSSRHRVRVSVGEKVNTSPVGQAHPEVHQIADDRLLQLAKKLCGKLALVDLADALNIPVEHAREFALQQERRKRSKDKDMPSFESWDQQWCHRARAAAAALHAAKEPHFDHVCHLRASKEDVVLVEMIGDDGGVKARMERSLKVVSSQGGVLHGPFHLKMEDGSNCILHGRINVRRVEKPTRRDKLHEHLLNASSWHDTGPPA